MSSINHSQSHLSDSPYLVILVQGFIGSIDVPLFQELLSYLKAKGIDFFAFDFPGHGPDTSELCSLFQMEQILTKQIETYQYSYPNKKIILLGHSQGSVVIYNYLSHTQRSIPSVFLTPAFDILSIISARLTSEEIHNLSTRSFEKEFRPNTIRVITPSWWQEYQNQTYPTTLPDSQYMAIFGLDDTIVKLGPNLAIYQQITANSPTATHYSIPGDHIFSHNSSQLHTLIQNFITSLTL